jgi:ribosome-associated protein
MEVETMMNEHDAINEFPVDESELHFETVQSGGPGGQNVNKVASAVVLRFDIEQSPSLPDDVKQRLKKHGGKRVTNDGILIIKAMQHRSQLQNKTEALQRFYTLLSAALHPPRKRRPTKRTAASQERRLEAKKRNARKKAERALRYPKEE